MHYNLLLSCIIFKNSGFYNKLLNKMNYLFFYKMIYLEKIMMKKVKGMVVKIALEIVGFNF